MTVAEKIRVLVTLMAHLRETNPDFGPLAWASEIHELHPEVEASQTTEAVTWRSSHAHRG